VENNVDVKLLRVKRQLLEALEAVVVARLGVKAVVDGYDNEGGVMSQSELWYWAMEQVDVTVCPFEDEDEAEDEEEAEEADEEAEETEDEEEVEDEDEEVEDEEVEDEDEGAAGTKYIAVRAKVNARCSDCDGDIALGDDVFGLVNKKGKEIYACTEECADNLVAQLGG